MNKKVFDKVANQYDALLEQNLGKFGKDIGYYAEYKSLTLSEYVQHPPRRILEFGCGIGRNLHYLANYFPNCEIFASDISGDSLAVTQKNNPEVCCIPDDRLGQYHDHFDLILVAGVFHHIAPEVRDDTLNTLAKLLSTNGELFIFEHNPYNPLTRRAVSTCPFDEDAILLPPGELKSLAASQQLKLLEANYCLFFPAALKTLRPLEKLLTFIPLGGQYFVHLTKPASCVGQS